MNIQEAAGLLYAPWQSVNIPREWRVYLPDGFLMNLTATFAEVSVILLAYKCLIDVQFHRIELL